MHHLDYDEHVALCEMPSPPARLYDRQKATAQRAQDWKDLLFFAVPFAAGVVGAAVLMGV